jgi:hypothetical protein
MGAGEDLVPVGIAGVSGAGIDAVSAGDSIFVDSLIRSHF